MKRIQKAIPKNLLNLRNLWTNTRADSGLFPHPVAQSSLLHNLRELRNLRVFVLLLARR
jgi:hypothetical protein